MDKEIRYELDALKFQNEELKRQIDELTFKTQNMACHVQLTRHKSEMDFYQSEHGYANENDCYAYNISACKISMKDQSGCDYDFVALDQYAFQELLDKISKLENLVIKGEYRGLKAQLEASINDLRSIDNDMHNLHKQARIFYQDLNDLNNTFGIEIKESLQDVVDKKNQIINKMIDVTSRSKKVHVDDRDLLIEAED